MEISSFTKYFDLYFKKFYFINSTSDMYWKDFYSIDFSEVFLLENSIGFAAEDSKEKIIVHVALDEIGTKWQQVIRTDRTNILNNQFTPVTNFNWQACEILRKVLKLFLVKVLQQTLLLS